MELFCLAQHVFYGNVVAVGFCVDYVFEKCFSVEDYVEFAHFAFTRLKEPLLAIRALLLCKVLLQVIAFKITGIMKATTIRKMISMAMLIRRFLSQFLLHAKPKGIPTANPIRWAM